MVSSGIGQSAYAERFPFFGFCAGRWSSAIPAARLLADSPLASIIIVASSACPSCCCRSVTARLSSAERC